MKFKIPLLMNLFFIIGLSQENTLFTHDWYLESVQINGINYEKPDIHDTFSSTFFTSSTMFTFMCETGGMLGNISVDSDNFEINFSNIFFDDGECTSDESTQFRDLFYSFFDNIENPVQYSITDESGVKIMILENNSNSVIYKSSLSLPPENILQNTWYLNDLLIDGISNPPPINEEFPHIYIEFEEDNQIKSQVCGYIRGLSEFYEYPNFYIQMLEAEGVSCDGDGNLDYENLYFSFFWNNYYFPFEYSVTENGSGNLTLTITDIDGNQAIYGNQILSVEDLTESPVTIYPNPFKDKLTVNNPDLKIISVKVKNALGKMVINRKVSGKQTEIDCSHLPVGVYFVSVEENGKVLRTEKVLKK